MLLFQYLPIDVGQRLESPCISPFAHKNKSPVSGTQRNLQFYFITSCARLWSSYKTEEEKGCGWGDPPGTTSLTEIFLQEGVFPVSFLLMCQSKCVGKYSFRSTWSVVHSDNSGLESTEKTHQCCSATFWCLGYRSTIFGFFVQESEPEAWH